MRPLYLMLTLVLLGLACANYDNLRTPLATSSDAGDARADLRTADGALDQPAGAADGSNADSPVDGPAAGDAPVAIADAPVSSDGPAPTPDGPPPDAPAPPVDLSPTPDLAPADMTSGPTPAELAFGCPADPSLRLCFTFDDIGTGTRLTDHSGLGNHGFLNTAKVAGGVSGQALSFSTGAHFAQVPDAESLRLAGAAATFEAWIRPTGSPVDLGADIIIGKVDTDYIGWAFAIYGNEIRLYIAGAVNRGAPGVRFGFWNHVAIVLEPAGVRIYVNGQQAGQPLAPLAIPLKTALVTLGNTNPAIVNDKNRSGYTGELDVMRIYARAKRADEICADADGTFSAGSCRPRAVAAP